MKAFISNKKMTILNFLVPSYFGGLYLLNYFKIDFVLVGVVRELITIPFLLALLFLSVMAFDNLIGKEDKSILRRISGGIVVVTTFLVIRSIFF